MESAVLGIQRSTHLLYALLHSQEIIQVSLEEDSLRQTNRLTLPPGETRLWTVNNNFIAVCQQNLLSLYDSYSL